MRNNKFFEAVYIIREVGTNRFRIGRAKNVERRFAIHRSSSSRLLELYKVIETPFPDEIEKFLHAKFINSRIYPNGSWYVIDDESEIDNLLVFTSIESGLLGIFEAGDGVRIEGTERPLTPVCVTWGEVQYWAMRLMDSAACIYTKASQKKMSELIIDTGKL